MENEVKQKEKYQPANQNGFFCEMNAKKTVLLSLSKPAAHTAQMKNFQIQLFLVIYRSGVINSFHVARNIRQILVH